MKKWIILTLFLGLSSALHATENMPINKIQIHRQHTINRQDELLDFLLKIPFEKRQYIFPMLSEQKDTSKKIKTHPDILVWKNKRPTRIAKRFQNDPELLEFLPAQFYHFLAPEMWPEEQISSEEANMNQLFMNFIQNHSNETDLAKPNELIELKNGLKIVSNNLRKDQKEQLKTKQNLHLSQLLSFNSPQMELEIRELGYPSVREFSQKVDKISLIYRQYTQGQNVPPSEEQILVKSYMSLLPFIFKETGFESLLDKNLYTD
jgi:hypothetical protein